MKKLIAEDAHVSHNITLDFVQPENSKLRRLPDLILKDLMLHDVGIVQKLKTALEDIASSELCKVCGGIKVELALLYEDRKFSFVCTEIKEKDKVVKQTNYEKLGEYCRDTKGKDFEDTAKMSDS